MPLGVIPWLDTAEQRITQLYQTGSTFDTIHGQLVRLLLSSIMCCSIGGLIAIGLFVAAHNIGNPLEEPTAYLSPIALLFPIFWRDYAPD